MVAEQVFCGRQGQGSCSLAKISMVAEPGVGLGLGLGLGGCSLAKISMVAELQLPLIEGN